MILLQLYKRSILLLFFLFGAGVLLAQESAQIKGRVVDSETGSPIPYSTIYFNNTSIGVMADSLGNYWLKGVPIQYSDLVFSSVGYESFLTKVSLSSGQVLTIQARLRPSKNLLNEVMVTGSRDKQWTRNYDRFVEVFMGTGANASSCEIENAGILNFSETADSTFTASANSPLEIYNHALGYKIQLTLRHFDMTRTDYRILFYTRFIELRPANDREKFRWQTNRLRSYKGSQRHFLKSLIDKRSHEEGFLVFYSPNGVEQKYKNEAARKALKPVASELLFPQSPQDPALHGYYQLLRKGTFEIHYLNKFSSLSERWYSDFPHPVSWLTVPNESLLCPLNGIVKSNSNYVMVGNMERNRIADVLPEDYDPVLGEGAVYKARHSNLGSIRGVITDSSGHTLAGAKVFINNSLYKTVSDYTGGFELSGIPSGVYGLVTVDGDYSVQSQPVEVIRDSTVQIRIRLRRGAALSDNNWDNSDAETKSEYARRYILKWFPHPVAILNSAVLEIKNTKDRIQLRTKNAMEIEDRQAGYKIHYYLDKAELKLRRGEKWTIDGFASFDTLSASNIRELDLWKGNRNELYRGSANHFMKSLAEGIAKEEGFEIYSSSNGYTEDRQTTNRSRKKGKTAPSLPGDSLLVSDTRTAMFKLRIPKDASVIFEKGKPTVIEADPTLRVSASGILSSERALRVQGPMERSEIPDLPIEYVPLDEAVSDPDVWLFIEGNEAPTIEQMREKIFLHTDKGYYYPGEKIWYKAYMRYSSQELKDSMSKVLYIELIGPGKSVIKNEILKIENGVSWGDISLPDTLKSGTYYLRAYTRWGLNFGEEDIFSQPLPVLATHQNIQQDKSGGMPLTAKASTVMIRSDQSAYRIRDRIALSIKLKNESGAVVNSNLSVSVTDASRIFSASWTKSVLDSTETKIENGNYGDFSQQREKEFSYGCIVRKEGTEIPASVVIASLRDGKVQFGVPDKDGRFRFYADFNDTASFIFRANLKKGSFGGHVFVETPYSPPVNISDILVSLSKQSEDVSHRIRYSYDPSEKSTILDEVIIRGERIVDQAKTVFSSAARTKPDFVFDGQKLKNIPMDMDGFLFALADQIPGSMYRVSRQRNFFLRRSPARFRINNFPISPLDFFNTFNPVEVERVEVFESAAILNIYLKSGADEMDKRKEFDRYTLSGYATPSRFYMRDYSKSNPDNSLPDLRTTIYWNPDVQTIDGESTVTFYAADMPTRYRITVEGLSDKGEPIYGEQIIEVKP